MEGPSPVPSPSAPCAVGGPDGLEKRSREKMLLLVVCTGCSAMGCLAGKVCRKVGVGLGS